MHGPSNPKINDHTSDRKVKFPQVGFRLIVQKQAELISCFHAAVPFCARRKVSWRQAGTGV